VITITEKEKQYLLSVDAKQFIDKLCSKSIFYELLQYDVAYMSTAIRFKIPAVIGLYNLIVNIIHSNMPEALNLRHLSNNKTRSFKVYRDILITFSIRCDNDSWQLNPNEYYQNNYEYIIEFNGSWPFLHSPPRWQYIINDTLLLKEILIFNHKFNILMDTNTDISEFISKMLILYNDFVDNIPV
jgi:hypothetical protein